MSDLAKKVAEEIIKEFVLPVTKNCNGKGQRYSGCSDDILAIIITKALAQARLTALEEVRTEVASYRPNYHITESYDKGQLEACNYILRSIDSLIEGSK